MVKVRREKVAYTIEIDTKVHTIDDDAVSTKKLIATR